MIMNLQWSGFVYFAYFLLFVHLYSLLVSTFSNLALSLGIFQNVVLPNFVVNSAKQLLIAIYLSLT